MSLRILMRSVQWYLVLFAPMCGLAFGARAAAPTVRPAPLRIVSQTPSADVPALYEAYYPRTSGVELIGGRGVSADNGRSWSPFQVTPDYAAGLPYGYRREPQPPVLHGKSGRILMVYNALDTKGVDPKIAEPKIGQRAYYLRYRVSVDAGRTWKFDEPIVQQGHTEAHPLEGVWKEQNAVFLGDLGCVPLFVGEDSVLVPVQICPRGDDGELYNPLGALTYHDTGILNGQWREDDRITWSDVPRIVGDSQRSTRGLFEPTLASLPDGRILVVMRGSNAKRFKQGMPSYKWQSVSNDGGRTWSAAKPWTYSNGEPFFSSSSMSRLFTHSSGRVFWIGVINPTNGDGNSPRYPLVIGEVDPQSLGLVKSSVVPLDDRRDSEDARLDLVHFYVLEDRESGEIVITAPRTAGGDKNRTWMTHRLKLEDPR